MKLITFKYRDKSTNWEWREWKFKGKSVAQCIAAYGLNNPNKRCEYEIINVKENYT